MFTPLIKVEGEYDINHTLLQGGAMWYKNCHYLTSWILNTDFSGFTVGHLDFFTYANYILINFS